MLLDRNKQQGPKFVFVLRQGVLFEAKIVVLNISCLFRFPELAIEFQILQRLLFSPMDNSQIFGDGSFMIEISLLIACYNPDHLIHIFAIVIINIVVIVIVIVIVIAVVITRRDRRVAGKQGEGKPMTRESRQIQTLHLVHDFFLLD